MHARAAIRSVLSGQRTATYSAPLSAVACAVGPRPPWCLRAACGCAGLGWPARARYIHLFKQHCLLIALSTRRRPRRLRPRERDTILASTADATGERARRGAHAMARLRPAGQGPGTWSRSRSHVSSAGPAGPPPRLHPPTQRARHRGRARTPRSPRLPVGSSSRLRRPAGSRVASLRPRGQYTCS